MSENLFQAKMGVDKEKMTKCFWGGFFFNAKEDMDQFDAVRRLRQVLATCLLSVHHYSPQSVDVFDYG